MIEFLTLLDAFEAQRGGLAVALLVALVILPGEGRLLLVPLVLLLLELLDPLPSLLVFVVILKWGVKFHFSTLLQL